jgi:hypothetical protein
MKKTLVIFGFFIFPLISFSHSSDDGHVFIIHMNEGGFDQSILNIQKGDTVIFENTDGQDRWPASNIHPSHAIYPEFDPKKPIRSNESWEFKFDKAGTWKFHDHLLPQFSGTINVLGENDTEKSVSALDRIFLFIQSLASKIASLFRNEENQFTSINDPDVRKILRDENSLKIYLEHEGISKTMDRLIEESGGGSSYDCHQEAHNIGRIGYELVGEEAFSQCNASCHSGCYHGAMENFLAKAGTVNLSRDIERICTKFQTSFGNFECLHGVGHGLLAYLNYDLPETLTKCKELKNSFSQSSCYGGVYMENILTGQGLGASKDNHTTEWVNRNDPYFPCNKIDQSHDIQYQCWQMQTSWMLTLAGYNFDTVSKQCLNAPKEMVPVCFKSLGRDISGHTLRNPEKIISLCKKVPDAYSNYCLEGALNVIVDFWGPALKDQASQLCRLYQEPLKGSCYDILSARSNGLWKEKDKKLELCDTFESPYDLACRSQQK